MDSHVLQILNVFPASKGPTPLTFSVAPLLWPVQRSLVGQDGRLGQVFVFTQRDPKYL